MSDDKQNLFKYMHELIQQGVEPKEREQEIWERYGRTVAVLILDSSGFSRVTESHGILHFLSRLMLMRQTTEPIFEDNRCDTLHFHADNVFAVFGNVDDAIRAALAVHPAIRDAGIMLTEDEHFRVCIGVGYGRMLYSETLEGYFSEEMNFASKLGEDTADGNETLLTESAFAAASNALTAEFEERVVRISGVKLRYYRHESSG